MTAPSKAPASRGRAVRPAFVLFALVFALPGCGWVAHQATLLYVAVNSRLSPGKIEIEVGKAFLEEFQNRVAIRTTFTIDKAMAVPQAEALDGDLHFAGRAPEVALPVVAEIANAKDEKAAIALVHEAELSLRPLRVSGVWRIWPEHAGSAEEEQGKPLPPLSSEAPDHVFEVHPVTRVDRVRLLGSFVPVKGFSPGSAGTTFRSFEKVACTLRVKPDTVSIVTDKGLYNDVEFVMELAREPQLVVRDGRFVIASAKDLEGKVVVKRLRTVFAKGTPPERAVRRLKPGAELHVLGMPRLDFAEISRRVRDGRTNPDALTGKLPYEIVVLGVYLK